MQILFKTQPKRLVAPQAFDAFRSGGFGVEDEAQNAIIATPNNRRKACTAEIYFHHAERGRLETKRMVFLVPVLRHLVLDQQYGTCAVVRRSWIAEVGQTSDPCGGWFGASADPAFDEAGCWPFVVVLLTRSDINRGRGSGTGMWGHGQNVVIPIRVSATVLTTRSD